MFKIKYRLGILYAVLTLVLCQTAVCAQYETVKATTVGNANDVTDVDEQEYTPTYNDPELPNFSPDGAIGTKIEKNIKNFLSKRKLKKINQESDLEQIQNEDTNELQGAKVPQEEAIEDKNKFQINADRISYDEADGNVYANGNVEIISKAQDIILKSDEAVLDKLSQTIKLYKNVKVLKSGLEMKGDYLLVDLNEQNILMDNPTTQAYSFEINAQESYLISNNIEMLNGTIKSNKEQDIILESSGFQRLENIGYDYIRNRNMFRQTNVQSRSQTYKIDSKHIVLKSYKDHNSLLLKGSNIYYNKHKIIRNSDIEIISDKDYRTIETNAPEFGSLRNFGTYLGYGFVFKMPMGHSLKIMPALTYGDSNLGVGVFGRYRSDNSRLEAGYNSSTTNLVVRGRYKLTDKVSVRYGRNAYMPEGFLGARRSGYAVQMDYQNSFYNRDLDLNINHGAYAGLFSEYKKHDQEHAFATTRFRYMAEARKKFFGYENKEQDLSMSLGLIAQGAGTVYGTGETTAVARIGPYISTKLKFWESSLGYMITGEHGDSPFIFDKYRYGKSSININERFSITNKFALGFRATVSPLKDNYEDKLLTESRLYAIFGPEDLKLILSYDFVRDIAHLDMMFILGTKSSRINFEKFSTENFDGGQEKRDFYKNAKPVKIKRPLFDESENI